MANPPIFIVGRFRAGTSFVWQLFEKMPQFYAWYEPLHPQLRAQISHVQPKTDHVGIVDYWGNFRNKPEVLKHYNPDFAHNGLWMEADSAYPELKQYLDDLMACSGEGQAVLQFNRMDFRLPWLKAQYPDAKIIHIKRKPMRLWYSQRKHLTDAERNNPSAPDAYELMQWSVALSIHLPFLAKRHHPHAFYRCYVLQKLSDLMAERCADLSLTLEADVFESDQFADKLAVVVGGTASDWLQARGDKHVPHSSDMSLEEMSSLTDIMSTVDEMLKQSGLWSEVGIAPLAEIKSKYSKFWGQQQVEAEWHNEEMLHAMAAQQTELTELMAVKNQLAEELAQVRAQELVKLKNE